MMEGNSAYIYVIGSLEHFECVKIGRSNNAPHMGRLQSLQTGNPFCLQIWGTFSIPRVHIVECEKNIHSLIGAPRLQGEWFKIHPREALKRVSQVVSRYDIKRGDGQKCKPYSQADAVSQLDAATAMRFGIEVECAA